MIVNKGNLGEVAKRLTHASEIYGDEVSFVELALKELVDTAEKYGCVIDGTVNNMWGNTVKVTAVPTHRRHSWSF